MYRACNKYHNKPTEYRGIRFASLKEAQRYQELLFAERAGVIRDIELQPRYDLVVNGHHIGFYKADFRYFDIGMGRVIVEDVKSRPTRTPIYLLKIKLVQALYDIDIVEVL